MFHVEQFGSAGQSLRSQNTCLGTRTRRMDGQFPARPHCLILIYVVTASSFWMQAEMCAIARLDGRGKKMSGELPQTVQKWIEIK